MIEIQSAVHLCPTKKGDEFRGSTVTLSPISNEAQNTSTGRGRHQSNSNISIVEQVGRVTSMHTSPKYAKNRENEAIIETIAKHELTQENVSDSSEDAKEMLDIPIDHTKEMPTEAKQASPRSPIN